jgi:hypothetical protein
VIVTKSVIVTTISAAIRPSAKSFTLLSMGVWL